MVTPLTPFSKNVLYKIFILVFLNENSPGHKTSPLPITIYITSSSTDIQFSVIARMLHGRSSTSAKLLPSQIMTASTKAAIVFAVRVKYWASIKKFKNIRYPFVNIQDIMEKNAMCHAETLGQLKDLKVYY